MSSRRREFREIPANLHKNMEGYARALALTGMIFEPPKKGKNRSNQTCKCGKMCYYSEEAAQRAIARLILNRGEDNLHSYQCEDNQDSEIWHVGHYWRALGARYEGDEDYEGYAWSANSAEEQGGNE